MIQETAAVVRKIQIQGSKRCKNSSLRQRTRSKWQQQWLNSIQSTFKTWQNSDERLLILKKPNSPLYQGHVIKVILAMKIVFSLRVIETIQSLKVAYSVLRRRFYRVRRSAGKANLVRKWSRHRSRGSQQKNNSKRHLRRYSHTY